MAEEVATRRSRRWPDPDAERAWTRSMTRQQPQQPQQQQQQDGDVLQVPSNPPAVQDQHPASEVAATNDVPPVTPQAGNEQLHHAGGRSMNSGTSTDEDHRLRRSAARL